MRPSFVTTLLVSLVFALGGLYFLRRSTPFRPEPALVPGSVASANREGGPPIPNQFASNALPPPPVRTASTHSRERIGHGTQPGEREADGVPAPAAAALDSGAGTSAGRGPGVEEEVLARVRRLNGLGLQADPASLGRILPELTNAVAMVRAAAREAAVQVGSREAVTALRQAAAAVEDPREKVAFLDAAELLELPSFNEVRRQIQSAKPGPPSVPRALR